MLVVKEIIIVGKETMVDNIKVSLNNIVANLKHVFQYCYGDVWQKERSFALTNKA